jgi:hypothetical protein
MKKRGSRIQVFRGRAQQTSGGLKKGSLRKNAKGKIVSVKKSNFARSAQNPLRKQHFLLKAGKRRVRKKPK